MSSTKALGITLPYRTSYLVTVQYCATCARQTQMDGNRRRTNRINQSCRNRPTVITNTTIVASISLSFNSRVSWRDENTDKLKWIYTMANGYLGLPSSWNLSQCLRRCLPLHLRAIESLIPQLMQSVQYRFFLGPLRELSLPRFPHPLYSHSTSG
jgi:hypothetical protein